MTMSWELMQPCQLRLDTFYSMIKVYTIISYVNIRSNYYLRKFSSSNFKPNFQFPPPEYFDYIWSIPWLRKERFVFLYFKVKTAGSVLWCYNKDTKSSTVPLQKPSLLPRKSLENFLTKEGGGYHRLWLILWICFRVTLEQRKLIQTFHTFTSSIR